MSKTRVAALIGACGVITVIALQWPDIKRYLMMKWM
ncbi:DUF6893 family small protein [Nonomuraea cavernae]